MAIRRLRLEYSVLLERLESRLVMIPNGLMTEEYMSCPPTPSLLDDTLNFKATRNGSTKTKKQKVILATNGASKRAVRDPNLPKRPTNAYLIYCEMEKEKLRAELEAKNPGQVVTDLSKTLTEIWKTLDEELRKPYYRFYEEDRDRYQREMIVYNKKKLTEEGNLKDVEEEGNEAEEEDDVEMANEDEDQDLIAYRAHPDEINRSKKQKIQLSDHLASAGNHVSNTELKDESPTNKHSDVIVEVPNLR